MVHHSGWLAYTSYLRGSLGLSTGPGGEICDLNPYFIVAVLHIIGSSALGLGGVFHSLLGPESLDNNLPSLFAITFKDRFKVSSILGVHLISLGIASGLLVLLGKYSGLYDTFASGGGDTRLVTNITPAKSHILNESTLWRNNFWWRNHESLVLRYCLVTRIS